MPKTAPVILSEASFQRLIVAKMEAESAQKRLLELTAAVLEAYGLDPAQDWQVQAQTREVTLTATEAAEVGG